MNRFDLAEQANHPRTQEDDFSKLVAHGLQRRRFLGVSATALGVTGFLGGLPFAASAASKQSPAGVALNASNAVVSPRMGFAPVAANSADTITLPVGYKWDVVSSWGDPVLKGGQAFDDTTRGSAASQALAMGDNNDGMSFFAMGKDHGVMAVNNEYTNYEYLFTSGQCASLEDARKAQAAHGVTVFEVKQRGGQWQLQTGAPKNRRITANTTMRLSGPVAGSEWVKTKADPTGTTVLGTFNNCANGRTPWGTYLTCEENFNGYFGATAEMPADDTFKRYGISGKGAGYDWHKFDTRFDLSHNPTEPNRFGWVVEIDPMDPSSTPIKRTALGRFKHENVEIVVNKDGRVVAYMGDDERGEHLYKFVSDARFDASNPSANSSLLDDGTLYVARFDAQQGALDGTGEWLELSAGKHGLTADKGFKTQADVLVHARLAATIVGATTMDRPEWVAAHPSGKQVYVTLTNNSKRGNDGQPVGGPNPRAKNSYGQILRWMPAGDDHASNTFSWDLFVLAGNPVVSPTSLKRGSPNVNADNMFNSPDGIAFDADGRLWIQTDGKYSNTGEFAGMGNNQMLCGDPVTGEIRRFLVGPVACEITGFSMTPDQTTMFVGVQHPGEDLAASHFPQGGTSVPRSSVIAISRVDGGVIGA
ncbi:MAG: PhoX family phosphatase [Burkholderiaceae bacterium]